MNHLLRSAQSRTASGIYDKRVPSFTVSRQQLKLPAACCRESSKWKVLRPFYCSSLANPVAKLRGLRSLEHFHEISGLGFSLALRSK
jgi:hypothetical protein